MLNDLLWIPTRAAPLLWSGGMQRSASAWAGYAVVLAALVLLALGVRSLLKLHLLRAPLFLLAGAAAGVCGAAMTAFGTHFDRAAAGGGTAIPGAQVLALDGPADADLGTLVLIGGFGSESPVFSEPAAFREAVAGSADPIVARFRKRVIVRLHGGFGWDDFGATPEIAAALWRWLEKNAAAGKPSAGPNYVVAHSRGSQVLALMPAFREHGWRRIAVHPPASVNFPFRFFDSVCPEIREIHRTGARLWFDIVTSRSPTCQPWDTVYQARGWDQTVGRFPEYLGLDLRNEGPFGSHVTPFCDRGSYFWREFEKSLPPRKNGKPSKAP